MRRTRSVAVWSVAALWLTSGAARAQVITEFSAGLTAGAQLDSITANPADGNLWFTEWADRVGRITPAGVITEFSAGISASSMPFGIAAGADGALWFTEALGSRIGRITTAGLVAEYSSGISASAVPYRIVAGPGGNLWFTETWTNRVAKIDASTHVVTEYGAGISANPQLFQIVAGPDGNMWFTEQGHTNIGMIDVGSFAIVEMSGLTSAATGITSTAGALWFTEQDGRIGRMTTSGVVSEYGAGMTGTPQPFEIATGLDGNVWFTDINGNRIDRLDTTTHVITEFGIPTAASTPRGITAGPDGNIWFVESTGNKIGRLTVAPTLGVTPASKSFGSVAVNSTSAQVFTLRNDGASPLTVLDLVNVGGDDTLFSFAAGTCASLTPTIPSGTSCTFSVTFSPVSGGAKSTTMRITATGAVPSTDIALTGSGNAGSATASVSGGTGFGVVAINTTSPAQTFTLHNTGAVSLVVSSIALSGGSSSMFAVTALGCPSLTPTLLPAASCTLSVTFTPNASGAQSTLLRITSNDPVSPLNVALSGGVVLSIPTLSEWGMIVFAILLAATALLALRRRSAATSA